MWECAIEGCGHRTEAAEDLLVHQANDHEHHTCAVCGTAVPDGYFAIRHVFDEHGRAGFVRAYGAEAADIRKREELREAIETNVDIGAISDRVLGTSDMAGTEIERE